MTARAVRTLLWLGLLLSAPLAAALQFPALSGRVVDQAGLLNSQQASRISSQLQALEAKDGTQLVVAIINSLQGSDIESYGYQLGRHWGIGQQGKDNGVLLIVAPNEKKVRIEVGYGLEGTLTDALSANIIQTVILPKFRDHAMAEGVQAGVDAIISTLGGTYTPRKSNRRSRGDGEHSSLPVVFIMGFVFAEFMRNLLRNRMVSGALGGVGAGLLGLLLSGIGTALLVGIGVFAAHLLFGGSGRGFRGGGFGGGFGGGGFGGGSFGGGGFSGGGGSFGGGGASGGW